MKPPLLLFSIVFITWLIVGAPAGFSDFQIILQLRRGCKYLGFNIFSRKGRIFFKGNLHNFLKYVFSRRGSKYYLRRSKILRRGCKYCKQSGVGLVPYFFFNIGSSSGFQFRSFTKNHLFGRRQASIEQKIQQRKKKFFFRGSRETIVLDNFLFFFKLSCRSGSIDLLLISA